MRKKGVPGKRREMKRNEEIGRDRKRREENRTDMARLDGKRRSTVDAILEEVRMRKRRKRRGFLIYLYKDAHFPPNAKLELKSRRPPA